MTDFAPLLFADLAASAAGRADDPAVVRGHAAGYAAGLRIAERELAALEARFASDAVIAAEEARARVESALGALAAAVRRVDALTAPVLAEADRTLAEAAVELAAAILDREPDRGPLAAIERALGIAADEAPRRIRLHPADLDTLAALEVPASAAGVDIVADDTVDAGGAILELVHGELDARIRASLDRARAALSGTGE